MAEAAVAIVINKATAAKAILKGEGHNLWKNISWIKTKMKILQSYLKDAESKKATDFINSIRILAQDVEDILDTYLPKIEESRGSKGPFRFLKHFSLYHKILSHEIKKFEKRANQIEESKGEIAAESFLSNEDGSNVDGEKPKQLFSFSSNKQKSNVDGEKLKQLSSFSSNKNESKVDGEIPKELFLEEIFERHEIKQKIMDEITDPDKNCRIISIVGLGGIGKTTLARKIYEEVKNRFDCSAMVYLSKESRYGDVLLDIAKQVEHDNSQMDRDMQEDLCSFLCKKKYVIFLDGVPHELDFLKDVVMTYSKDKDKGNGSRIIVTCRETKKPSQAEKVFQLDNLRDEEGQKIFHHLLTEGKDGPAEKTRSGQLETKGDEILQKCHGHPLLIQVAASVLKTKETSIDSWNKVLRTLSKGSKENIPDMIFDLGYQDLPTELKPFLLYCGIFPMNREIFMSELIQLWLAEKLVIQVDKPKKPDKIVKDYTDKLIEENLLVVQLDKSKKPDEIVEDYIDKLIDRNLIQVFRRRSDGRVKSCGIQNILHDPCTRKAKEINFFCPGDADLAPTARRVVSDSSGNLSDQNRTAPKELRALFGFTKGMKLSKFIETHASELRFLQLLSIEVEYMAVNIPVEIAELSRLIYLKLKGQFIKVPSSIRKMKRLQTLEVRSRKVPSSILKMKHLLHLTISGVIIVKWKNREEEPELEVDLQNLQTLDFDYQYGYNLSPNSLKKLRSLKKLKISIAKTLTLQALCNSITSLQNLEDLKLRVGRESDIPTRVDFSGCKNLRTLCLLFYSGDINITCSFKFPDKLVKITLEGIRTEKDPLDKLRKLPNLKIIKLKKCTAGTIDFSGRENFPQLQTLILYDTHFTQLLPDEEGILPNLESFIYKAHRQPIRNSKIPKKLWEKLVAMTEAEGFNARVIPVV